MKERRARRACACAFAALVATATVAWAASMADLRAQANAVAISPGSGGAAEEGALDRLGRIALAFLAAVEGDATGARATYEAIAGPLERSHAAHRAALDRLSQRVVDEDGDMDALFESAVWRQHQALATQSLYYLNWLRYQGARLYEGAKRKALLEEAATGFGEFATAGGSSPIVIESHLGRGLANMELDQVAWAIADFEAVVQAPGAPPERVRKARLALAEVYIRAGRSGEALTASERALAGATVGDRPRAQVTRARALLMAAASRPGQKAAYQSEARGLLADVKASGGSWGRQADRILRAGLDNPQIWAGPKAKPVPPPPSEWDEVKRLAATGKYSQAIPRLQRIIASSDAEDRSHRREARYLLGVARFKTGAFDEAAAAFDAVLAEQGGAYYRDDAAYLRFKIKEARYLADPSDAALPTYEAALREFLAAYPQHAAAAEAHYRLGEIRQRSGRCGDAIAEYARVAGDPAFEVQATFGTAQCAVTLLEQAEAASEAPAVEPAVDVAALERTALAALAAFRAVVDAHPASAFGSVPIVELSGRAALMGAYLAALAEPPDYAQALDLLEDFETTYPMLADEAPQVVKLRLAAATQLTRLDLVAVEAARPAVAALDPAFLDQLSRRLLTAAAREKARGELEQAAAGRRAVRALAEQALASSADLSPRVRHRLRVTLASLYEDADESERALVLYREILADEPDAVSARAGAARVLEASGRAGEARALWDEITAAPQGRSGWLEAHYQSARLSAGLGEVERACALLGQVPEQMLTNTNSPTPRKIQDLRREFCHS
jgi:TolA-binding protein